jgi:two-component system sensor histidine kinase ChvG
VKDPKARQQLFDVIDADVRRIDRLISDISAASRVDAELSRTRLQPVDLGQLAAGLVAAQTAAGPLRRGITMALEVPPAGTAMVTADADRLTQVINNLIDNAMGFSPDRGTITLRVVPEDPVVELSVTDEGPGVAPEQRDAIFERFYTERPGHELYGHHSGLGLSIARAIVEALDGSLRVEDRADGRSGAVFVVTLPAL